MKTILRLDRIGFSFAGRERLLDGISVSVEEAKIYDLIGANGAEKTTLFNILTGFIRPNSGEIVFGARTSPASRLLFGTPVRGFALCPIVVLFLQMNNPISSCLLIHKEVIWFKPIPIQSTN